MTDDNEFRRGLEGIVESGHEVLARQRELEAERAELIAGVLGGQPVAENPVRVTVDNRFLVESIAFDEDLARALAPAELVRSIAAAIILATARPVSATAPIDLRAAAADPEDSAARLESLLGAEPGEPERFADDFGNFSVSARLGAVTSVEALDRWVTSSPLRMVGEEITRIAREAMLATDSLGWHSNGGGAR
jgi:hypothetical protein